MIQPLWRESGNFSRQLFDGLIRKVESGHVREFLRLVGHRVRNLRDTVSNVDHQCTTGTIDKLVAVLIIEINPLPPDGRRHFFR